MKTLEKTGMVNSTPSGRKKKYTTTMRGENLAIVYKELKKIMEEAQCMEN
jgi:predicted transcriptional regulator